MTTKAKPKTHGKPPSNPMCRAKGCPNMWTVDFASNSKLCTKHAWAPAHLWPIITREQLSLAELVKESK